MNEIINQKTKYSDRFRDFAVLEGCFGDSRITPSNIDGIVEHNGNFLVIEFKSENTPIPTGQKIMLKRLSLLEQFTVLIVWHEACAINDFKIPLAIQQLPDTVINESDIDDFRYIVKSWFKLSCDNRR